MVEAILIGWAIFAFVWTAWGITAIARDAKKLGDRINAVDLELKRQELEEIYRK